MILIRQEPDITIQAGFKAGLQDDIEEFVIIRMFRLGGLRISNMITMF